MYQLFFFKKNNSQHIPELLSFDSIVILHFSELKTFNFDIVFFKKMDFILPAYLTCCDITVQTRHSEFIRAKCFGDFP